MYMKTQISNVILIHGCPGNEEKALDADKRTYNKHWIPWTKQQLIDHGIPAETPAMPSPWQPNYETFKEEFEKYSVSEDSILIGHSCGCAFLVRWLGESKQEIAKLILVAPWKINDHPNDKDRDNFYTYDIDETIKNRVGSITMFTANDEEPEGKESLQIFNNALGGEIIELEDHGHYTLDDMNTEEFPELIKAAIS